VQFIQNAFEMAGLQNEAVEQSKSSTPSSPSLEETRRRSHSVSENPHRPYLNLATFRMVILADELLETFFDVHFTTSWKLEEVASTTPSKQGFFSGFVGQVLTEEHRVRTPSYTD
jgi:hypothetical protein